MSVARFGVSLESELLEALDAYVMSNQFPNRSQAIRQLIQNNIVESKWKCNNVVAGGIMLAFDFNKVDIQQKISDKLKSNKDLVLSVQQFYISENKVMEIVAVKGPSYRLTELSESLIGIKGVEHGKLAMSKVE
jgi:CopG family transcriptional regulator, nickel-responsive regulator